ncbi:pilus assembly protein CpaE [Shewanella sp. GutCb]|uniref:AAA family ATPase n=1 Tax=Shewanella sp. GutCb TaxID=2058315 RepID=UPI000C7C8082|nr:pilus assembly protein CpaE [Shewanella sp. GutCb]PKG73780.1 pilus assembly protein CpaE [Shewanella sp. GutCb]
MDNPLELCITSINDEPKLAMPMSLPFPVKAIVTSNGDNTLDCLTTCLNQIERFTWTTSSYIETYLGKEQSTINLVLLLLPNDELEAKSALAYASNFEADIILIGQDTPPHILRLAFQYNVSDFIPIDATAEELFGSIEKVSNRLIEEADLAPVLAVVNGKSGSGASFISASLADVASQREGFGVCLLDTDLHHGSLAHILGMKANYSICDALWSLEELDEVALKSTMTTKNNLNLMASKPFELLSLDREVDLTRTIDLVRKCRQFHKQVILDFSRGPEHWNGELLLDAKVLVVTQQNIMHLRQTKDLIQHLTINMGISPDKISLVVNRYDKQSNIKLADIKQAVGINSIFTIVNDYKLSSECVELGKSITEIASKQKMLQDIQYLVTELMPLENDESKKKAGFWGRLLGK